jgi:hypothetical protein
MPKDFTRGPFNILARPGGRCFAGGHALRGAAQKALCP